MNDLLSRLLAAALMLLPLASGGCMTTYYQHEGIAGGPFGPTVNPGRYEVSTGRDTGPRGDTAFVHPKLVAYAIAQPESNLAAFYRTALVLGFQKGQPLARAHVEQIAANDGGSIMQPEERQAYQQIQGGKFSDALAIKASQGLARVVAEMICYACALSMSQSGYARVAWGSKVDEDFGALKMGGNGFYVTVNKDAKILTVHCSPAHTNITATQQIANIEFEKVKDSVVFMELPEDWEDQLSELEDRLEDLPAGAQRQAEVRKQWEKWWGGPRAWKPEYEKSIKRLAQPAAK